MLRLHTEMRQKMTARSVLAMVFACACAVFAMLSLVFVAVGVDPLQAIPVLLTASFKSGYHFSEALVKATPIIFTSLAVALALKMKLWNIGAEGQLYMGAFGAVWAAQTFSNLPAVLLIPIMLLSACICGALTGGIVGALKRWLNVNEILTSLLLNYVVTSLVNYFIYGPWRDPQNPGFPITARFVDAAKLPQMFDTRLHIWFILALAVAFVLWFVLEKTSFGFEIRATGESRGGAQYAGIPIDRNILLIFALCGAIAALAGMGEVAGIHHKLQPGNISKNYGSLGVIVAWLSGANPLAIIFTSFFAGVLLSGAENLQVNMGVSSDIVQIVIGLVLASILVFKYFKDNRVSIIRPGKEGKSDV